MLGGGLKGQVSFYNKKGLFLAVAAIILIGGFFVAVSPALAAATVAPASGGTNISIDTTSAPEGTGTYKTLTGPSISDNGDIAVGTHTISLPSGWEFDTISSITISVFNNIILESTTVVPGSTSFSFVVTSQSTVAGFVGFSNLKVRPTGTTPSNGNMTYSGVGIAGVTGGEGGTNFGTLSTVPGTVKQLVFATQPGNAEYGSFLNLQPVVRTQDQFGNNSSSGASGSVTLAVTSGIGTLQGTASLDISSGKATFTDLKMSQAGTGYRLTASSGTLTPAVSNTFNITPKTINATVIVSNKDYDGNIYLISISYNAGPAVADEIEFIDTKFCFAKPSKEVATAYKNPTISTEIG